MKEGRKESGFVGLFNKTQVNAKLQPVLSALEARRREHVDGGYSDRHYVLSGGTDKFPALMSLRLCPLILLIEVYVRKNENVANEEG